MLIAEGIGEDGKEGKAVFPGTGRGRRTQRCGSSWDPIDGTRGIMYDKRSAWFLAGVAENRGEATRLSDIFVAAQVEVPTSKQGAADILWGVKGEGAKGMREFLRAGVERWRRTAGIGAAGFAGR